MSSRVVSSVCPYCGVGCGMQLTVEQGRVSKITGDKSHPANRGRLCTKGLTAAQPLTAPGRLDHAELRLSRALPRVAQPMNVAITETANRLRDVIDRHGPQSVAFYVSGQMSMEAQYLANKLAKGFIGSNHIDSNSRLCMSSAASGYKQSLGADAPPGSYDDIDHADLFLLIGSNMADCHPILFLRLLDRVRAGAKLIVVDPRRTNTAEKADVHLAIRPGTDLAFLNGLLRQLVERDAVDHDFIARYTDGWPQLAEMLEDYDLASVSARTKLAADDITRVADMIANSNSFMTLWTMGLNQSTRGTWHTNAVCNLHLATGKILRQGCGPFSLTGQPNAMGGREMGYLTAGLPGQRAVTDASDRAFIEALWQLPPGSIDEKPGLDAIRLYRGMQHGEIRAVWIICTNPVATMPNRSSVIAGLEACELVIVQDAFADTETARYADIVLPGALWAEAEGVMVNSERNITLMQKAVEPPGEAMADWQIIARVAQAMGFGDAFDYADAAAVFDEIRGTSNVNTGYDLRGISHARLRDSAMQWPSATPSAPRNPQRYHNDGVHMPLQRDADGNTPAFVFATKNGRAQFFARPALPPAEMPDDEYPLVLNTGRLPHQWHTLTKTGAVAQLTQLNPGPFVEIHPDDAKTFGISAGDDIEMRSRRGVVRLPVTITSRVAAGNCFATFHWNDRYGEALAINALTNDAVDEVSQQPEFKHGAVTIRSLGASTHTFAVTGDEDVDGAQIHIGFASQTGNAERIARAIKTALQQSGIKAAVLELNRVDAALLASMNYLVVVASTYGDGDAPDNGAQFLSTLRAMSAALPHLHYAVLALGDSNYTNFCRNGREIDARLAALGAQSLLPRVDCDVDFELPSTRWFGDLITAIQSHDTFAGIDRAAIPESPFAANDGARYTRNAPFAAKLIGNRVLNKESHGKEVRQFVFALDDDFEYEAGDALGVWPQNDPALVAELLDYLQIPFDASVDVDTRGAIPISKALQWQFDIVQASPELLHCVLSRSADAAVCELLQEDNAEARRAWLYGRALVDVLRAASVKLSLHELLPLLKPLQPRLYSIASSQQHTPHEVHLTVSVVRYQCGDAKRGGVASTFLADRAQDGTVPIFIQKSPHFRVPENNDTAMIMIGPGTGIAPFRAFLQERAARGARGKNWLFFGEQHEKSDFYYRDEIESWLASGVLSKLSTAFSRDQADKIYVQQRLREHGAEVWQWINEGAHIGICGDAGRMAKDVDHALREIIAQHGGMSDDDAAKYLQQMSAQKRYVRDVY